MKKVLKDDPRLVKRLVPDFPMGCRRLGPAEGFLEAMLEPNVTLVEGAIKEFTPKGILTDDGVEHEVDVIICATGFDVSFRPYFPIIGREGKSLSDKWEAEPQAYFAMAAAGFPNFMRMWPCSCCSLAWFVGKRLTIVNSWVFGTQLPGWSWIICHCA